MQAAARLNDALSHTGALDGLVNGALAGAVAGAAVIVAAAVIVGTGGLTAPLVIGIMLTGIGLGGWIGEFFGSLSFFNKIAGKIATGSHNVFINSRGAARAETDKGQCSQHGPDCPQIATGSSNVFINGSRAARVKDKLVCGGVITEGSPTVFIGGGTFECKTVEDEVPWQARWLVIGSGIVGALLLGGAAAIPAIVGGFAVGYVGGEVMRLVGREAGDWLSENIGGTPSDWEKAGAFVGQAIGGWLGAKGGTSVWGRVAERFSKKPIAEKPSETPVAEKVSEPPIAEKPSESPLVENAKPSENSIKSYRAKYGVKEENIQVESVGEVNGKRYYDTNQQARNPGRASPEEKLAIYDKVKKENDKRVAKGKSPLPNKTMEDAHAEVGVLHQAMKDGVTKGQDMTIKVTGTKRVCDYCMTNLKDMGRAAELKSLRVEDFPMKRVLIWKEGERDWVEIPME
jgi:uncharacterized Zn-binding protein involved in type VI secretion